MKILKHVLVRAKNKEAAIQKAKKKYRKVWKGNAGALQMNKKYLFKVGYWIERKV